MLVTSFFDVSRVSTTRVTLTTYTTSTSFLSSFHKHSTAHLHFALIHGVPGRRPLHSALAPLETLLKAFRVRSNQNQDVSEPHGHHTETMKAVYNNAHAPQLLSHS